MHRIGVLGTVARVAVGGFMAGSVIVGHLSGDFHLGSWILGLVVFPMVVLAAHGWLARRSGSPLVPDEVGFAGHCAGLLVVLTLYLFEPTSDAALLFYGSSMLLAAARGNGGCEMLAFSNWALRRDDELACPVFGPVDRWERRRSREGVATR